jgi:hypothetical protein
LAFEAKYKVLIGLWLQIECSSRIVLADTKSRQDVSGSSYFDRKSFHLKLFDQKPCDRNTSSTLPFDRMSFDQKIIPPKSYLSARFGQSFLTGGHLTENICNEHEKI